jgi:hypothetical protein
VRIRRRHHVGWGRTRAGAFFGGFGQALLGTFWFAAPALAAWAVLNNGWSTSTHSPKANVGGAALISLMAIPGLILMVRGSLSMVNSLLSLGRPHVVEGWVLRFREVQHTGEHGGTWYERSLVVDDGRSSVLDRWPVPDGTDLSLLQEGNGVRVRVLRRIGRIRSVEATSPAPVATALPAPAYSGRL